MIAKQGRVSWALLVLLFIFLLHSQRLSLRPQNTQSTITGLPSALDVPCSPTGGDRRPPRVPPPPPPLPLPLCDAAMLTGLLPNGTATWSTSDTNTHAGAGAGPPSFLPRLVLERCVLRRFTASQARQCLAGRPLVFIGDSLSRYQYLSLVSFLDRGSWPRVSQHPSLVHLHQWGADKMLSGKKSAHKDKKLEYLRGSTDAFGSRMRCDCSIAKDWFESRTYEHQKHNITAHFMWWRGWPEGLEGHWGHPPFLNATPCHPSICGMHGEECPPGQCSPVPDWSMPLPEALRQVVAQLRPAAILLNAGLWRNHFHFQPWPPAFSRAVARAAVEAVAPQRGMALWRTTTPSTRFSISRSWDGDFLGAAASERRLMVLDAWELGRPLLAFDPLPFFDRSHPWPEFYTELNTVLLNMLC